MSITRGLLFVIYVFNYDGIITTFLVEKHMASLRKLRRSNFSIDRICLLRRLPSDNQWAYKAWENLSWMSFLLGEKRHENVVSKERESSQAQTSHPVKNDRSQSEIRIRKSWSPRFLRKKKALTILNWKRAKLPLWQLSGLSGSDLMPVKLNAWSSLLTLWLYEDANTSLAAFRTSRLLYFAGC